MGKCLICRIFSNAQNQLLNNRVGHILCSCVKLIGQARLSKSTGSGFDPRNAHQDKECRICTMCGRIDECSPSGKNGAEICCDCEDKTYHRMIARIRGMGIGF